MSKIYKIFLVAGLTIGSLHLLVALAGLFTISSNEPIAGWIMVLCGPFSTLPAVLTSLHSKKASYVWLAAGGLLSLAATPFDTRPPFDKNIEWSYAVDAFYKIAAPMWALAVGAYLSSRKSASQPKAITA